MPSPVDLRWLAEARTLAICGLTRPNLLGWDKVGLIKRDPGGAYGLEATMELALLADLRLVFSLDDLAAAWNDMRRRDEAQELVRRAVEVGRHPLDLLVEPELGTIIGIADDAELIAAIRRTDVPRTFTIRPQTNRLQMVLEAFDRFATVAKRPTKRKAGRPPLAAVRSLREGT